MDEAAKDILKDFHRQFAENQNANKGYFISSVGMLGFVVFAYAYVYAKYADELAYAYFVSEFMLFIGAWFLVAAAYNFRRDQMVNNNIRKHYGLIGDDCVFPVGFDFGKKLRERKKNCISWMPDFFIVFYTIFPVIQWTIAISYYLKILPYKYSCLVLIVVLVFFSGIYIHTKKILCKTERFLQLDYAVTR